jgi:phosphoribosylformylglycinamidine synthase
VAASAALNQRALLITPFADQLHHPLPPHAHAVSYAPFDALLPRLAALVHHGGIGTTAQALAECVMRFGIGARVWLDEIVERDGVDLTSALFSESTARAIVTVPREDDVKFVGLCEARGFPVLRIGVTDLRGPEAELTIQDVFTVPAAEIRERSNATLPHYFA